MLKYIISLIIRPKNAMALDGVVQGKRRQSFSSALSGFKHRTEPSRFNRPTHRLATSDFQESGDEYANFLQFSNLIRKR